MEQPEVSYIVGESANGTWGEDLAAAYEIRDKTLLSDKAILLLDIDPRKRNMLPQKDFNKNIQSFIHTCHNLEPSQPSFNRIEKQIVAQSYNGTLLSNKNEFSIHATARIKTILY